jgi:2-polyprenyl-6-methoxyphenol hydroxylase-like FAD-dependent oxidoreductase
MLGFLLARAGVEVLVLEKHADFLRDFRGDTIHPSTLEIMHELGVLDEFLKRPHQELSQLTASIGGVPVTIGDFTHLPTRCKFIAFMPQWDFLNFIAEQAARYRTFHLRVNAEVIALLEDGGRITGLRAKTPQGMLEVRTDLVVGADGRHSVVRENAGLKSIDFGAPMDALWMRISKKPEDPRESLGFFDRGKIVVLLDRDDYWQCALVIPKGAFERLREGGLEAFREGIAQVVPFLGGRLQELNDWNQIKLLTVLVDRLEQWCRPGLLCIGDAAHAMSPIGGVGINLAIQDAVAAANILAAPLSHGAPSIDDLRRVQRRRQFPTTATQRMQLFMQNNVVRPVLAATARPQLPLAVRLLQRFPVLRRIPARLVGLGFRPEHVRTPAR